MRIHHNTFLLGEKPAIVIRGQPVEGADIHHNRFAHSRLEDALRQEHAVGGMRVGRNLVIPEGRVVE